jgi:hypothetical protein
VFRAAEIRQQLARIVESAGFRDSLRLTRFINFVVESELAGRSERTKAYTIAVEALGRNADFDPQTNAIVRVEAGRLRRALARYYAGTGRDDPLVIELPRGSYVPSFQPRGEIAPPKTGDPRRYLSANTGMASDPLVEIAARGQQLNKLLVEFRELIDAQVLQVREVNDAIVSAKQTLDYSRAQPVPIVHPTNPVLVAAEPETQQAQEAMPSRAVRLS